MVLFCNLRRKELGRSMVNNHSPPNQRHTIDRMRYEYDNERKLNASHYFIHAPEAIPMPHIASVHVWEGFLDEGQ